MRLKKVDFNFFTGLIAVILIVVGGLTFLFPRFSSLANKDVLKDLTHYGRDLRKMT